MSLLFISLAGACAVASPATVFDARSLNWDERCMVEALQGLVNRRGPRLYLDLGYPWDRQWLDIYARRNDLNYQQLNGLRRLLKDFGRAANGFVVYDPQIDGSRYVAITLAGVEGLLPVTPSLLEGRSPALLSGDLWAGIDFARTPGALDFLTGKAGAEAKQIAGQGMEVTQTSPDNPWGFVTFGPVTIDLDAYPLLEVTVAALRPQDARWGLKLTWDRNGDGRITGPQDDLVLPTQGTQTGTFRWNIPELAGIRGKHVFWRVQLHALGRGAHVVFRSVRFVSTAGEAPPAPEATTLTELLRLPVKRDLRGRFHDSVAAYRWALREIMPRCDRRFAHAVNGTVEGIRAGCGPFAGFDWPVMHRGFVFNLTCSPERQHSYGDSVVGGSRRQARMYRKILSALEPPAMITGYGEPEGYWCRLLSQHGHYSFHFGDNWSFHTHIKPRRCPVRQKQQFTPRDVTLDPHKFYVCVMTSEGDTMKGPIPFFYGSWFEKDRGRAAVNWGINPLMGEYFPAMLEYFYETATDNDYFFAGCSGAGYCYPEHMPNLRQFAQHTRRACQAADITCIDLWGARSRRVLQEYADAARPMAMTVNLGRPVTQILRGGVPAVGQPLMYWQNTAAGGDNWHKIFADDAKRADAIQWLRSRIEQIAARHYPPFVILVYSDLHHYSHHCRLAREIADALDSSRFQVVRLDYALAGLRSWAEGRVLVGLEGINERLAWAALGGATTHVPIRLTNASPHHTNARVTATFAGQRLGTVDLSLSPWESRHLDDFAIEMPATVSASPEASQGHRATVTIQAGETSATYPVEICAVPASPNVEQAHLVGLWDAVGLQHSGGRAVADKDALWDTAWAAQPSTDRPGHIVYGPYAHLPSGRYLIAFRLKLLARVPDPSAPVATLDVFAGGELASHRTTARQRLTAADFAAPNQWQWFILKTNWSGPPDSMETRVWWEGKVPIALDCVAVFRTAAE